MPLNLSQHLDQSKSPEVDSSSETLFLLSVCRDEDDAAALRSDLKRSGLASYKIQRCVDLDDAIHLLQVCGFDLAFLRLDDFQDPQAAVSLVRQNDPELAIVSLTSSRLLNSESFRLPNGIDGNCRLEDLSPSLVSSLVSNILKQKREQHEHHHLAQELELALDIGELGTWTLDVETGRIVLSEQAAAAIGAQSRDQIPFLDDFVERMYSGDHDRLKRLFDLSIETQGDLDANFRLAHGSEAGASVHISAIYRPGGPRSNPTLSGMLKRESKSSEEIQARIEAANQAIQKALSLRDDAIAAASKELALLAQKIDVLEPRFEPTEHCYNPNAETPAADQLTEPEPRPQRGPAIATEVVETTKAPLQPAIEFQKNPATQLPAPQQSELSSSASDDKADENQTLGIDKSHALQQVLKSITRQKKEQSDSSFPFDFSTESVSNYTEPSPQIDGFIGAAKRLIDITQNGQELAVTLSVENDGVIETERERDLLFEILKELLTNVVKHARATECIIALFRDEDEWVLQVEDDGVGLENNLVSISTPLNKIGLFRIRTKLALKGGQLDLTPTFPRGLIARARIPVSLLSRGEERA
ncbi:ATP-binding protein [Pelagicoccus sp. SDUM812002]|uniref:sensor histidine kinase n=1 Tax=Pelagicoccus sp. SDUM812002 TaxID=3041266 RepID=UPI00280D4DA9|nr:ATP-binding protein [Pelagicoccus sp. SDUM812002]MDQ8185863.1 hypothetical protein [Pelagicoccus sp. SDUM812002]